CLAPLAAGNRTGGASSSRPAGERLPSHRTFRCSSCMKTPFISPYQKTCGLVWFARMVRKLRLWQAGELPPEYLPYVGKGFDRRCLTFLRITLEALLERIQLGGADWEILE